MYAYSTGHIQLNSINATDCIQPSATMNLQPSEMMEFNAQTMVFLSAPYGSFNFKRKTTPPGRSHNKKRLQANSQREATTQTYSTSVDDIKKSAEESDESDLTELDIEEGHGLEECKDVDEKEEKEEEEDDVEE
jgi:hypothetical protein